MLKRVSGHIYRIIIAAIIIAALWFRLDHYQIIDLEPIKTLYSDFGFVLRAIFFLFLVAIGVSIFLKGEDPAATTSWLLVFVAFPVIGFLAYLVFGRSFNKERTMRARLEANSDAYADEMLILTDEILRYSEFTGIELANKKLIKLLENNSGSPLTVYNETKVYIEGESQFMDIIKDIEAAKSFIHLEYFIIKDDKTGSELMRALEKKASQGVIVKLIYDDVGSLMLNDEFFEGLKAEGGRVYSFLPVWFPSFTRELNYRNHRKILIVDGEIAYIGGMNIADEYRGKSIKFSHWRDTHLRIMGDAVWSIAKCFSQDWEFVSSEKLPEYKTLGKKRYAIREHQIQAMQIVSSGPDGEWESMMQAFLLMISSADNTIKITTPYLVPDKTIMDALRTAALAGVEVDIVIPDKPDHFFVYWATRANLQTLLESGVRIHEYKKGFIHSKGIVIDGKISSIGTANFDMRSLKLNFEINSFIYDAELSGQIEASFDEDIRNSVKLDVDEYKKRQFRNRVLESVGRIVSPLQ